MSTFPSYTHPQPHSHTHAHTHHLSMCLWYLYPPSHGQKGLYTANFHQSPWRKDWNSSQGYRKSADLQRHCHRKKALLGGEMRPRLLREVGLVSYPSLGHAQCSCHPVASKKHCSHHLVWCAEVKGTAKGSKKEGVSTFVGTGDSLLADSPGKHSHSLRHLTQESGSRPLWHPKEAKPSTSSSPLFL